MTDVYIESVGLAAPGLVGWKESQAILRGDRDYMERPMPHFSSPRLPANERRRMSKLTRLAMQAAQDSFTQTTIDPVKVGSVFSASEGESDLAGRIIQAVTSEDKMVSPTDFHNSVHNAAAGYWALACKSNQISTSLSGGQYSFAVGMLEALMLMKDTKTPILFVCYGMPPPPSICNEKNLLNAKPFAVALLLTTILSNRSVCRLGSYQLVSATGTRTRIHDPIGIILGDSAAVLSLTLLRLIAAGKNGRVSLPYSQNLSLVVTAEPCR